MPSINLSYLDAKIIFRTRPEAIPGDLRPLWRISVILLVLRLSSIGNKSTMRRLYIFNWAILSEENRNKLRELIRGSISPDEIIIRFEPSLSRALDFARGEGLLEFIAGKRVQLTLQGLNAAEELLRNQNILVEEKNFLREI